MVIIFAEFINRLIDYLINCYSLSLDTLLIWSYGIQNDYKQTKNISLIWKHSYSNILKISPPKTESFQIIKAPQA